MILTKCIRCLMVERRFILIFGVVYSMSVIAIIRKTAILESELDLERSEEITVKRKARLQRAMSTTSAAQISNNRAINISNNTHAAVHPVSTTTITYNCDHIKPPAYLEPGKLPLTALHSFPGSGNTWVRMLLSSTTGINTGDIYRDGAFAKVPGFSFRKDDTVIAVKTHHPFWDDNNGPDVSAPAGRYWERAIIVIRHPLDATISVYNWFRMKGSHTNIAPLDKYINKEGKPTKEWNKWAHDQIRNWGRCLQYWINIFKGPKVIVFYEDLRTNLTEQLVTMNQFLGLDLDTERLHCTVQSNAQQKFHRKQKVDKRLLYDTSMLNEVEKVLQDVHTLISTNYTHIRPGFRIPSNYAVNLIRENFSVKPNDTSKRVPPKR